MDETLGLNIDPEGIPPAWAAGCLRAIVPTLEDRGILFMHLDEFTTHCGFSAGSDTPVRWWNR
jgi:hypothetical protein